GRLRCRVLHGAHRTCTRPRCPGGRPGRHAEARWTTVPVHAQPDAGRFRRRDPGRRIPDPAAAARHPSLPAVHQALGAGAPAAPRGGGTGRHSWHRLQPAHAHGAPDRQHRHQLPSQRTQTGMTLPHPPSGVLFDLDGTLLDSAPGLYAALEACARELDLAIPPYAAIREVVSRGAGAVLKTAWPGTDAAELAERSPRFLELYAEVMAEKSDP